MSTAKYDTVMAFAPGTVQVIASVFPTVNAATDQAMQNAIDSGAGRIFVDINVKGSWITIEDDGRGCSRDEFNRKLGLVAESLKASSPNAESMHGKHGIGLLAFAGKADHYLFISAPKEDRGKPDGEGYTVHNFGAIAIDRKSVV